MDIFRKIVQTDGHTIYELKVNATQRACKHLEIACFVCLSQSILSPEGRAKHQLHEPKSTYFLFLLILLPFASANPCPFLNYSIDDSLHIQTARKLPLSFVYVYDNQSQLIIRQRFTDDTQIYLEGGWASLKIQTSLCDEILVQHNMTEIDLWDHPLLQEKKQFPAVLPFFSAISSLLCIILIWKR